MARAPGVLVFFFLGIHPALAQQAAATKADAESAANALRFLVGNAKSSESLDEWYKRRQAGLDKLQPTAADFKVIFEDDFAATAQELFQKQGEVRQASFRLIISTAAQDVEAFVATSDDIKAWRNTGKWNWVQETWLEQKKDSRWEDGRREPRDGKFVWVEGSWKLLRRR